MKLEDRLPSLLHYPWDDTVPPVSAAAVIVRARRRRARRRLITGAATLVLATGTALLASGFVTRTTPEQGVAAHSPVRTVALEERLAIVDGAQMWLEGGEACVNESAGWLWDPIGITGPTNCALYRNARLSADTSPSLYEAMGLVDPSDNQTMPVIGTYAGPTPADIVISSGRSTAVATLVTSPQLHEKFGYFAYLHHPADGASVTVTAYDDAGHVLTTVTWPGIRP